MAFLDNTRQSLHSVATMSYEKNRGMSYELSKVGALAKVYVRFKGTTTAKHATKTTFAKAPEAPFNLANRVRLVLNNGIACWDTSGYGCYLHNLLTRLNNCINEPLAKNSFYKFDNKCSAAGTKNDLEFVYILNVGVNERDLLGLLPLQNDGEMLATVQIDNDRPEVLTTDTDIEMTVEGAWHISIEYFSIPDEEKQTIKARIGAVHQVLEDSYAISSTGQNRFSLPRGATYLKLLNRVYLNGEANDEDVERLTLKYNLSNYPYDLDAKDMRLMQLERYGRPLPTGVFVWDFMFSNGLPNLGTHRDFVNTENITEFDQVIHIKSGTTFGNNNNKLMTIRDMLIPVN